VAQQPSDKVKKHLKDVDVSTIPQDVLDTLDSLSQEELDVLARVRELVRGADDKVKAQIV
jgi:hypothetical protein